MLNVDPTTLWDTIVSNPVAKASILTDRQLGLEAFVDKHSQTLHAHYAQTGDDLDVQDARTAAAALWRYIQQIHEPPVDRIASERQNTEQRITTCLELEAALRLSEARFRLLLEQTPSIAAQGYGPDGTIRYWNQAAETLYGYSAQEAIGRNILDLIIPPEMRAEAEQSIRHMATTGQPLPTGELSLRHKDGRPVPVISSHAVIQIPGREVELFCLDMDITERKRLEERLLQQNTLDELTGVFNRRHFMTLARDALKRASRLERPVVIALIDLDHLKQINDTRGHLAGDQALVALARCCQENLREIDLFARFGGDEFIVLLQEATPRQAYDAIERIRLALATQPVELAGFSVSISISAGISSAMNEQDTLETLLERADQALYQAKGAGRNRVEIEPLHALATRPTPGSDSADTQPADRPLDADRRGHPRRPAAYGVQLQVISALHGDTDPCSHHGVSRDLSECGMQVLAEQTYPLRTPIVLAVEDAKQGCERLQFHVGSVVWAHSLPGERRCVLGIKFGDGEDLRVLA